MHKQCFGFALAALVLAVPAWAQVTFEKWYGGAAHDNAAAVLPVSGGYVLAGTTCSFGVDSGEVWVIWTDLHGDTTMTRRYRLTDKALRTTDMKASADGGYIIAADTRTPAMEGEDCWFAKITTTGDTQWTRVYGDTLEDHGSKIVPLADGYIVLANNQVGLNSNRDFWLFKLDLNGNKVWEKLYGGPEQDYAENISATSDGGYILTGLTESYGAGAADLWLLKTNAAGDTEWTRTYGTALYESGLQARQTLDGGYIISGFQSNGVTMDWYIVKTDAGGIAQWTKVWGGPQVDCGGAVLENPDSTYVLGGLVNSDYATFGDICLFKVTSTGDSIWCRTHGGSGLDMGTCITACPDGGFAASGYTNSYGAGGFDAYFIKTDANGNIGIAEPPVQPTDNGLRLTAEPNPLTSRTTVRFSPFSNRLSPLGLRVFDATGRCVHAQSPISNLQSAMPLDLGSLPAGVYRCVLESRGTTLASVTLVLAR